jgi:phosphoglycolate phosphatase
LYKLAIFDFDGTLVDSAPGIIDVMREIVEEYELPPVILDEWRQLVGIPLPRQMQIIFPEKSEQYWSEVATRYRTIYDGRAIEICPLFPGVIDVLDGLKRSEVAATIVSSKRKQLVDVVLDYHNLQSYFRSVMGEKDVHNHKPHPEAVHKTVEKLGIRLEDSVVIGDSLYDLDMARNAGVDAIGVTTGVHSRDILTTAEPKFVVNSLEETLPIILNGRLIS